MVKIDNKRFLRALRASEESRAVVAARAGGSRTTLDKIEAGSTDMQLAALGRFAAVFGLDVLVTFIPSPGEEEQA